MALFPAYKNTENIEESKECNEAPNWLTNSSFNVDLKAFEPSTSEDISGKDVEISDSRKRRKVHKPHKKKKDKKLKQKEVQIEKSEESNTDDCMYIDKQRNFEFLKVSTIARPAVCRYRISYRFYGTTNRNKRKFKRYFQIRSLPNEAEEEQEKITKKDLDKPIDKKSNDNSGFKQEEDMSQTTAYYNRSLTENPKDIELWLKYVRFQDTIFQFEKTHKKGSFAKGKRVTAERKLCILDKALHHNPQCEALMRERLYTAVSVYPADELQIQLKTLVEKEPGNIIMWQGYIEATQCSMSHCNTPAILKLYTKCLSTLHQLRRSSALERAHLEESILRMLYQCGLFLKQSGLFEQLWTLLRLYLELNLAPTDKNKFNISSGFDDKQLVELEEVVLNSQLPIHELWLRIERLREACHWLPYIGEAEVEDPQRIVFTEDVAELIHPITMPGNTFKLTVTILTLLKIPLLPCRHTTMHELGLDYVPWALDSIETLLPIFFPVFPIDLTNKNLLKDTQRLAVGPQYLKTLPGQEEYLEFLLRTIKNCTDCLHDKEKIAITVWWFRFQRLLIILDKQERFKMSSSFKKKIKNFMKQLLKTEEHRNNVIFYQEYALCEFELGNTESAINVLITALTTYGEGKSVSNVIDENQISICSLYRTLIELHLHITSDVDMNKQKILKYLVSLALGKNFKSSSDILTQGSLNEAGLKFKHVTLQLLQSDVPELMIVEHFLPNFFTDWIVCNGWFLYLTQGPINCGTFLEESLDKMEKDNWQKEILYEFYVAMLFKHCIEKPGVGMFKLLNDALFRAVKSFPNNLFLLSVIAKEQSISCCLGQPWWKLSTLLMKTGHALPSLFLLLIANQRMCDIEETWIDTITGKEVTDNNNLINRMISLFKQMINPDMCTRRCGLVWRLYLQFLHAHFDPSLCRKAYYAAVEECPWLKALYIDAAIYIPAELAQIQDLLIEKQLRLHITPEELDILRN